MGIKGLTQLLQDMAPGCLREDSIKNYFNRKVAIDASMALYQFLIAVRQGVDSGGGMLTDESGETTSHLMGMFYRTIRLSENGIKPAYVFDGKPPEAKAGEIAKRREARAKAEEKLATATDATEIQTLEKRLTRVAPVHNEEAKRLLRLLGVPVVESPGEAEAQCAELAKGGKVFATGSEDMDALTLGTPTLLRHLTFSEARKMPILEINLARALEGLQLNMDEFIDLCILCGCDYCPKIGGIGPKKAYELIKKHKSIDAVVEALKGTRFEVPENFAYENARKLFHKPDVTPAAEVELTWGPPNREAVIEFMCKEKGFDQKRIEAGLDRLTKSNKTGTQGRLDSFFKIDPFKQTGVKRKSDGKSDQKGKKGKTRK